MLCHGFGSILAHAHPMSRMGFITAVASDANEIWLRAPPKVLGIARMPITMTMVQRLCYYLAIVRDNLVMCRRNCLRDGCIVGWSHPCLTAVGACAYIHIHVVMVAVCHSKGAGGYSLSL